MSTLDCNGKALHKEYNIAKDHKEILLDFDQAQYNAFIEASGKEINNIFQGCSLHFACGKVGEFIYFLTRVSYFHVNC